MSWVKNSVWWLAGLFFALSLVVQNGYNIGAAALLLLSVVVFFIPKLPLTKQDKWLMATLGVYFVSMILFVYLDGWHTRELDRPSRFLLVIPVMLLLLYSKGPRIALWVGVVAGAYGALTIALYERFVLGENRAGWGEHPIMFGDTSMMLGLLSAAATLYFFAKRQYIYASLAALGVMSGIMGSLLSGSRGGWVAIPLIMFFMLWQSRDLLGKKLVISICLIATASLVLVLSVPQLGISKRISEAVSNVEDYADGDSQSSVGMRFEMWKANLYLFTTAPFLGVGEYHGLEMKQQLAEEGKMLPKAATFAHAHNEYINALGLRGLLGFAFLMAVYLVPLRLFLAKMSAYHGNWNVKAYAMAGALVPMCYMDFALTQTMFSHNIGVIMYAFPIAFFWAATRWAEREHTQKA